MNADDQRMLDRQKARRRNAGDGDPSQPSREERVADSSSDWAKATKAEVQVVSDLLKAYGHNVNPPQSPRNEREEGPPTKKTRVDLAPLLNRAESATSSTNSLPLVTPPNLGQSRLGHEFPSALNEIATKSSEVPASKDILARPPGLPFYPPRDERHEYSLASLAQYQKIKLALPDRQRKEFETALKKSYDWCSMEKIADGARWPITTRRLTMYLSSMIGESVEAIKRHVAGLKEWSIWVEIEWNVQEEHLKTLYASLKSLQSSPKPAS
ncbi:uncharacterized protein JCM15063_006194 [Sporobolomyces koalae]|uniref:uncharacterized protein n=1 Tax=Sporobolomyces koalae TaxID=500713 RepID=UPI00317BC4DC